jgi:predicted RNA-binding protein with PIN domain
MTQGTHTTSGTAVELPVEVRAAILRTAAEVLGSLDPLEVPAGLRHVHKFAPRRRATAGALPLWTTLTVDDGFRGRVARVWSQARPRLADHIVGTHTPADEPSPAGTLSDEPAADVAVGAWLLRPAGWQALVDAALRTLAEVPDGEGADAARALEMARERADRAEADAAQLAARLGVALVAGDEAREDAAVLRREQRRLRADADRARSESRNTLAEAQADRVRAEGLRADAADVLAHARDLQRAADTERLAARGSTRAARELEATRVRLLLDTIVDAADALRDELALPPVGVAPADLVAPTDGPGPVHPRTSRGRSATDPALLDDLLALPHAHLVVDGYNVSKSAYGDLALAEQRRRLVGALANMAARTGAEITCCFDGQEGPRPAGGYARAVRVLFSVGEIADDLIRRLVRAEPPGRVVVVVTSDQEVATDVQADGAWAVPAQTLIARLSRL